MRKVFLGIAGVFAATVVSGSARAAVFTISADPGDYEAHRQVDTGALLTSNGASGYLRIGTRTTGASGTVATAIFPFQLPAIAEGEEVTGATLSVMTEAQTSNLPVANADLYGLPFDATPLDADATRFYNGPNDTTAGVTKLEDNFLTPADVTGTRTRYTSVDISSYINSLYAAGAVAGDFAILRLSYDVDPIDTSAHNRFQVRSRQATSTSENPADQHPILQITTTPIPEPATAGLAGLAGAGMLLRRRPR